MESALQIVDNNRTHSTEDNYALLLDNYQLPYKQTENYWLVGEPCGVQGWILHLSVIKTQIAHLFYLIIPYLIAERVPFKIVWNRLTAENLLSGVLGYHELGKIVGVYPETDAQALTVAKRLIRLTEGLIGPAIPTDRNLGGCVYTRFGAFTPIVLTNPEGRSEKFIYDSKGLMTKDEYNIPFLLKDRSWPFGELTAPEDKKSGRRINKFYLPVSTLKSDSKGSVIKAFDLHNWLKIRYCIIKQGKANMLADDNGRTMKERFLWQKKMQTELQGIINVPRVTDHFELNGDSYLVMDYVEGTRLTEFINASFQNTAWFDLSTATRTILINDLLQVIDILTELHGNGYIHRDVMPNNFLKVKSGKLVCIDLELCYSTKEREPIFAHGTNGFISPEQFVMAEPQFSQDIYSLGALMIMFFTNISPVHFDIHDVARLKEELFFFIRQGQISELIASCLAIDPQKRPQLKEIKRIVKTCTPDLVCEKAYTRNERINPGELDELISRAVASLVSKKFTDSNGIWLSRKISERLIENETSELTILYGLSEGVSGVLYSLSRAKIAGYDISPCINVYDGTLHFLKQYIAGCNLNMPSGLYYGAAGIALSMISGCDADLMEDNAENRNIIKQCLLLPNNGLNIASGIAGQGLASLSFLSINYDADILESVKTISMTLIDRQLPDGSWVFVGDGNSRQGIKLLGLSNGVAGVAYFLLKYGVQFKDQLALGAARKALDWLETQLINVKGKRLWPLSPKNEIVSPCLNIGFSGICLPFITAYEIWRTDNDKKLVETVLQNHPPHLITIIRNQSNGMIGVGQIYLEAAKVFGEPEWQTRADWIAGVMKNNYLSHKDRPAYWLQDNSITPTVDLMSGTTGIIDFLIQYNRQGKLGFPAFT